MRGRRINLSCPASSWSWCLSALRLGLVYFFLFFFNIYLSIICLSVYLLGFGLVDWLYYTPLCPYVHTMNLVIEFGVRLHFFSMHD